MQSLSRCSSSWPCLHFFWRLGPVPSSVLLTGNGSLRCALSVSFLALFLLVIFIASDPVRYSPGCVLLHHCAPFRSEPTCLMLALTELAERTSDIVRNTIGEITKDGRATMYLTSLYEYSILCREGGNAPVTDLPFL